MTWGFILFYFVYFFFFFFGRDGVYAPARSARDGVYAPARGPATSPWWVPLNPLPIFPLRRIPHDVVAAGEWFAPSNHVTKVSKKIELTKYFSQNLHRKGRETSLSAQELTAMPGGYSIEYIGKRNGGFSPADLKTTIKNYTKEVFSCIFP